MKQSVAYLATAAAIALAVWTSQPAGFLFSQARIDLLPGTRLIAARGSSFAVTQWKRHQFVPSAVRFESCEAT
jgi:hypothetical protein